MHLIQYTTSDPHPTYYKAFNPEHISYLHVPDSLFSDGSGRSILLSLTNGAQIEFNLPSCADPTLYIQALLHSIDRLIVAHYNSKNGTMDKGSFVLLPLTDALIHQMYVKLIQKPDYASTLRALEQLPAERIAPKDPLYPQLKGLCA